LHARPINSTYPPRYELLTQSTKRAGRPIIQQALRPPHLTYAGVAKGSRKKSMKTLLLRRPETGAGTRSATNSSADQKQSTALSSSFHRKRLTTTTPIVDHNDHTNAGGPKKDAWKDTATGGLTIWRGREI